MSRRRKRCAIYTRKSTDEGLDQEFSSLDAQREACEALIRSQKHEGWVLSRERYDDGGISGATMDRPALTRLLDHVRSGAVDVIVVYKVDRLTRSLSDFAKMVEIFDAHGVSFVSVTQQFNTTTSMGRLTLNVLLSFAQFEREVTAERIRDKIAASKKKGMWMGGVAPLGYDVAEGQLVVSPKEAETVRTLFELYLSYGNVRQVHGEAARLGLRTKIRPSGRGGLPLSRGHIYRILSNPIYVGEITHKDRRYPGRHEAIVDRQVWERVQQQLAGNRIARRNGTGAKVPSLLGGLLRTERGRPMVPSHANKSGRRYRYYVSQPHGRDPGKDSPVRLPAGEIERLVLAEVRSYLGDRRRLLGGLDASRRLAGDVAAMLERAATLRDRLAGSNVSEQRSILLELLDRVEVTSERVRIFVRASALEESIGSDTDGRDVRSGAREQETVALDVAARPRRHGTGIKLVVAGGAGNSGTPDPKLTAAIARAHAWLDEIQKGTVRSMRDLARRTGVDRSDVGRTIRLALLAPDIVEAILAGRQPAGLTLTRLRRLGPLPLSWAEQRRLLGFSD